MKPLRMIGAVILVLGLFFGLAHAELVSEFHLTDGTVLRGVVIAHSGKVYSIRSKTLGVLRIHESKIRSISTQDFSANSGAASGSAPAYAGSGASASGARHVQRPGYEAKPGLATKDDEQPGHHESNHGVILGPASSGNPFGPGHHDGGFRRGY